MTIKSCNAIRVCILCQANLHYAHAVTAITRHSTGIPEVSITRHAGILLPAHGSTIINKARGQRIRIRCAGQNNEIKRKKKRRKK
jgi:hypothetical protein